MMTSHATIMTLKWSLSVVVVLSSIKCGVVGINWNEYPDILKPAIAQVGQQFGMTLALDDNYLVIGTNQEHVDKADGNGEQSDLGTVTIFKKGDDNSWDEMEQFFPTDGQANDKFGSDVNIYNGIVIVGDQNKAIAIYRYNSANAEGSRWVRDEIKEDADASCGYSVEIYGNYAVYGCPTVKKVKIYDITQGSDANDYFDTTPVILDKSGDTSVTSFGDELAMYDTYLAISSQEKVFVYTVDNSFTSSSTPLEITVSPLLRSSSFFGRSLSMYGERLVVATRTGGDAATGATIKTYKRSATPAWVQDSTTFEQAYAGVAVGMYDDKIIGGFYNSADGSAVGSVKVYTLNTDTWSEENTLTGTEVQNGDHYGRSVAVWGNYYVIGAPYDESSQGAVYMFDRTTTTVSVQVIPGTMSLSMTMALYQSDSFTTAHSGTVTVNNNEFVYVGLKETTQNDYFKFIVKRCWATPTSSSSDSTYYDLYNNRCPHDETFDIKSNTNDQFNFEFLAFEFTSGGDSYVHCEIIICLTDDTSSDSCIQTCDQCDINNLAAGCPIAKRRRRAVGQGALVDFVLASNRITIRRQWCVNMTCGAHSKCVENEKSATCVCDDGYVMSIVTRQCSNTPVISVPRIRLPLKLDGRRFPTTLNTTEVLLSNERALRLLMRRDGCGAVFDGVRLANATLGYDTVVYDVLLLHKRRTSQKAAHDRFMAFLEAADLKDTKDSKLFGIGLIGARTNPGSRTKGILKTWSSVLLIIGVICAVSVVIPLSMFILRRMKKDSDFGHEEKGVPTPRKKSRGKIVHKFGTDNIGVDIQEPVDASQEKS